MLENINMADPVTQILAILLGIVILVAGRRLFWVTIGVAGFIFALFLTLNFLQDQPLWLTLAIAVVMGIIGAFVAILLQQAAVALAGLLVGGYLAASLFVALAPNLAEWQWIAFIVGAVIGFILMVSLFEIALVVLSSFMGAALITQAINLEPWIEGLLLIILPIIGILVQLNLTRAAPPPPPPPDRPISQRAKRTR
jgi:hypothetical protein